MVFPRRRATNTIFAALALALAATAGRAQTLTLGLPDDAQLDAMLAAPDAWPALHARTAAIVHADHSLKAVDDDTLRRWFAAMRAQHLTFELEVGAIKEWSRDGAQTLALEAPTWRRALALGAPLTSIAMDEPLIAARSAPRDANRDTDAVEQVARFVLGVRRDFPGLRVTDIEPYPAVPEADHAVWLAALDARLTALGTGPLDGYRVDPDWAAFPQQGDWPAVARIAAGVRARGLPFSLILWAATAPRDRAEGRLSARTWPGALQIEIRALSAVKPDHLVIESWVRLPDRALPESDPNSFAGAALGAVAPR